MPLSFKSYESKHIIVGTVGLTYPCYGTTSISATFSTALLCENVDLVFVISKIMDGPKAVKAVIAI